MQMHDDNSDVLTTDIIVMFMRNNLLCTDIRKHKRPPPHPSTQPHNTSIPPPYDKQEHFYTTAASSLRNVKDSTPSHSSNNIFFNSLIKDPSPTPEVEDIIGSESISGILFSRFTKLIEGKKLQRLLFYGPSGSETEQFTRGFAKSTNIGCFQIQENKTQFSGVELAEAFKSVKLQAPCIIFFDIEKWADRRTRSDTACRLVELCEDSQVLLIFHSTTPWLCSPQLLDELPYRIHAPSQTNRNMRIPSLNYAF